MCNLSWYNAWLYKLEETLGIWIFSRGLIGFLVFINKRCGYSIESQGVFHLTNMEVGSIWDKWFLFFDFFRLGCWMLVIHNDFRQQVVCVVSSFVFHTGPQNEGVQRHGPILIFLKCIHIMECLEQVAYSVVGMSLLCLSWSLNEI